jgi:hypothetical protein
VEKILGGFAAFWNLLLLVLAVATLSGFVYRFYLRKLWRARRIARAQERRMLREAAERGFDKK